MAFGVKGAHALLKVGLMDGVLASPRLVLLGSRESLVEKRGLEARFA